MIYKSISIDWLTGDQPVARPLPIHRTQTQNKHTQTSMYRVGFEPIIPVFQRAKKVQALDRAAAVIVSKRVCKAIITITTTHVLLISSDITFRPWIVPLLGWGHTSARSTYVATHIPHDGRCWGYHTARVNLAGNSGGEDAAGHMLPRENMASVRYPW
jgi:hypothetical protein